MIFRPIDDYCKENGILEGKWWHHSKVKHYEEWEEFENRTKKMRQWLAKELMRKGSSSILSNLQLIPHTSVNQNS